MAVTHVASAEYEEAYSFVHLVVPLRSLDFPVEHTNVQSIEKAKYVVLPEVHGSQRHKRLLVDISLALSSADPNKKILVLREDYKTPVKQVTKNLHHTGWWSQEAVKLGKVFQAKEAEILAAMGRLTRHHVRSELREQAYAYLVSLANEKKIPFKDRDHLIHVARQIRDVYQKEMLDAAFVLNQNSIIESLEQYQNFYDQIITSLGRAHADKKYKLFPEEVKKLYHFLEKATYAVLDTRPVKSS